MRKLGCFSVIALVVIVSLLAQVGIASAQCKKLVVIWNGGTCPEAFLNIAKEYTKETGVEIVGNFVGYGPQWHDKIAAEFAAKGAGFDLAAWDSQSVAEFAGAGHCLQLNDRIEKSTVLALKDFDARAIARYGEFPDGSGKIWALPINQDSMALVYRKDLFDDPKEKEAFKKKYGYDLAVPETYTQLRDIAEFFTRPDQGLYGFAQYGGREYDFATSSANSYIWSFGGELWNPQTNEFEGYINSPASVDAIQFFIDMFKFSPPGSNNWGYDEINSALQQGKVAMGEQWFFFFASIDDPKVSKIAGKAGFANLPGQVGRDGKFRREVQMGGQGIGINIYSKCVEESWKFIEWWETKAPQWAYGQICQSARLDVVDDPKWQGLNKWNKAFSNAVKMTNDYWHLPEYMILLDILQEEITNAIAGKKTVKQAMDDCAKRQEREITRGGYKITRTANIPEVPDQLVTPVGKDKIEPLNN